MNFKKRFLTLTFLLLLGNGIVSADFDKGHAAAQSGDFKTALAEWTPMGKQGHQKAQYQLGMLYQFGLGVRKNYKTAIKWYKLSADQGDIDAQYNLGMMYLDSKGVKENYKEAAKWFSKAAQQGSLWAQHNLGSMYTTGKGVIKNVETGLKWYLLAAKHGQAANLSQRELGLKYVYGNIGTGADYIRAYMWWDIAGKNGDGQSIENKEKLVAHVGMTSDQIAKAKTMSSRCMASDYKNC